MFLRRDATYVTSAILPIVNVDLTSLPIARILLILKAELFLRPTREQRLMFARWPLLDQDISVSGVQ